LTSCVTIKKIQTDPLPEFLLEREPKESILTEFELPLIGRYFPEYEPELKRRIGSAT
jgi:hypothetical protein